MNRSIATPSESNVDHNPADAHQRHKGFIVFCETKLHYEKGFKAWIFLGPYLFGALGLEMIIDTGRAHATTVFWPWIGFLAYLVLFPPVWQRILKFVTPKKATPVAPTGSSATDLP